MLSAPPSRAPSGRNPLLTAAALVVVIYGLSEAKSILEPIVVAIFMAIICAPGVRWLERRRVPNVVAVLLVVAGIMAGLTGVGVLVGSSIQELQSNIHLYQERIGAMAYAALHWAEEQGIRLDTAKLLKVMEPGAVAGKAMQYVGASMSALTSALSNTILVVLTMILILIEGRTIPAKLRALSDDPYADISHFQRIASDVQRYLGIKTVVSLATGLLVGIWALILDVDFAFVWGLLAFLLNYIPNIGSILAAFPACILALIQHGPGTALALGAGYVVANMALGNVVEPMWMGRKLGLSTVVVFLSLVVWGGIWGPTGMLLSVPLTMVVKIMCENSAEWSFIAVLLGGEAEEDKAPLPGSASLRAPLVPDVGSVPPSPSVTLETPAHPTDPPAPPRDLPAVEELADDEESEQPPSSGVVRDRRGRSGERRPRPADDAPSTRPTPDTERDPIAPDTLPEPSPD